MHDVAVYVMEGLPFARDVSLENSVDSCLCFRLVLLLSVSCLFFLCESPSSLCTGFDSVSYYVDEEVLWINPSANVFVFGDFNIHHKNWLTYSGRTDRAGELYYNFSISNDFTPMVNFPTCIPDWDLQTCSFRSICFFWCEYLFYNRFPSIGKFWSYCCLSFHWFSVKLKTGCPVSLRNGWLFLCWLGQSSWSFKRFLLGGYL